VIQHIVLVDDEPVNLAILGAIIADIPGALVHQFTASSEAVAWADKHAADAFIIDYNMPDPDGLTMIGMLRADPRYELVPIIVITGEREVDVRLGALAAGANDFLERPVERREVLSRLQRLLALQAAHVGLVSQVGDLEAVLRAEERRSRAQAERLATLWRVTNASYDPRKPDMLQAVLSEGAAGLRSTQAFFGSLLRVEGDDLLLVASVQAEDPRARSAIPFTDRIPIVDTAQKYVLQAGATRSWNDVALDPQVATLPRVVGVGEHALISTPFLVGRTQYLLSYGSAEPTAEPFGRDDHTYVELLADFFASRLQQAAQSDQLLYHMSHDILTGLRNRTQFRLDARTQLILDGCGTLVVISLDGFRGINEEFGHIIGDALLVEVGAALSAAVAERDIVGRLAGDTFGIFFGTVATESDARTRLEKVIERFTRPFSTGDREGREFVPLGATIGAAIASDASESIDQLLARADTAVFAAKQHGPGRVELYQNTMESEAGSRSRRLAEISEGLERNEFELFLQPHIDLTTWRVTGAEALLRWRHPQHGLLLPLTFLPFAEHNGLIRTITRWVTGEALCLSQRLRGLDPDFRLYFNLSAIDFSDEAIVNDLQRAKRAGAFLDNVGVELTETAAMQDVGNASRTIRLLQQLGVCVAIDDFGTGYSSLSMLKRLPFDIIKIDKSFVHELLLGDRNSAIAASVIAIGKQLGCETLAEGVESPEQLAWLRERGCRYAQGYTIARPMSLDAFETWFAQYQPSALAEMA
jgi:diguanylate cyclase (GGDEF)-like protein